jgi:hypothetical protein
MSATVQPVRLALLRRLLLAPIPLDGLGVLARAGLLFRYLIADEAKLSISDAWQPNSLREPSREANTQRVTLPTVTC